MPQRVFNYRLSRARKIIENAFGIASARFRCLRRTIDLSPEKVTTRSKRLYAPPGYIDTEVDGVLRNGAWREDDPVQLDPLNRQAPVNPTVTAKQIQTEFTEFL